MGKPYPAISALRRNAWELFTPFLDYDGKIRKALCSTISGRVLERQIRKGRER